jgi:effector-binding domain-containing protein
MVSVPGGDPPRPELVQADEVTTAVVCAVVPMPELAPFFDSSFTALARVLGSQGVGVTGPAFGLYHAPPGATADLEVGFATERRVRPEADVVPSSRPGGRVARVVHHGGFDSLGHSWQELEAWIRLQGLTPGAPMWEVYVTKPSPDMDPDDLRTELSWTVVDPRP